MTNPNVTRKPVPDMRVLRNDELDAVNGGKAGERPVAYMVIKLEEALITGV